MFEVTIEAGLEPGAGTRTVLDRAREARRAELAAAADLLVVAAEWADLHPVPRNGQPAGWGEVDLHGEGLVPLAGKGPRRSRSSRRSSWPDTWGSPTTPVGS